MAEWSQYSMFAGAFDADIADMVNIEDFLFTAFDGQFVHPTNPPVNHFPLRDIALSGDERGDGAKLHEWNFVMPLAAIQEWIDTLFKPSGVRVVTRDMTILTLDHEEGAFVRWNAKFFRPIPGEDYTYDSVDEMSVDFKQRMLLLEELED